MEYSCSYCGSRKQDQLYCSTCLKKIDWVQEVKYRSIAYYNKGYEAAKVRNLTLASTYLKNALLLDKYHIEARNLLGLIYFEVGQVELALKEWFVSQSLQKEKNLATYYIEQIQENKKILSSYKEGVLLYNKGLEDLKRNNIDMALIRFKKAMSYYPQLVEARVLIVLSYIHQGQFYKAQEQLEKILLIDKGYEYGLLYYKKIQEEAVEAVKTYKIKGYIQLGHILKNNRMIAREKIFRRYFLYFLLGAIGMFGLERYLILPSERKSHRIETERLKESEDRLAYKIQDLTREYKLQTAELENQRNELQKEVTLYQKQVGELEQKQKITQVKEYLDNKEYVDAARVLHSIASNQLDENFKSELEQLKNKVYPTANERLYNEGTRLYNQKELVEASIKFETILLYEPDERLMRKSLYSIGCIYEQSGDLENAKKYFEKVIEISSGTIETRESVRKLEKIKTS